MCHITSLGTFKVNQGEAGFSWLSNINTHEESDMWSLPFVESISCPLQFSDFIKDYISVCGEKLSINY